MEAYLTYAKWWENHRPGDLNDNNYMCTRFCSILLSYVYHRLCVEFCNNCIFYKCHDSFTDTEAIWWMWVKPFRRWSSKSKHNNHAYHSRKVLYHYDVIKWKHLPRNWPFVRGIHRSPWRPVTRSFDVFFDLHQYQQWSKQWGGRWFETPCFSFWPHCNVCDGEMRIMKK